jgi:hypothetical protein
MSHTDRTANAEDRTSRRGYIMKNAIKLFVIGAIVASFASPAFAQVTGNTIIEHLGNTTRTTEFKSAGTNNLNIAMLKDFASVKQNDPAVAPQLAKDPRLVENRGFLQKHPSLQAFLEKYPDARHEIETNPGNFMPPVAGSKWATHEAAGIPRDK